MANTNEIERRRTFAIISHPDAGKTTLTEKLLLFGGQIQVAGAVKSNKIRKTATSDWMEIEKQRGISVTTSVMEFDYDGYKINILDTPGHQDFAEDTFRTLTAVDSVIIVVDSAKGVEAQTRKLMEDCRMRKTPVIIIANKMDREGKDPFDLLDELESELHISVLPLSWPIDQGPRFKGVYNRYEKKLDLYQPNKQVVTEKVEVDINSDDLEAHIGEKQAERLRADLELVEPFSRHHGQIDQKLKELKNIIIKYLPADGLSNNKLMATLYDIYNSERWISQHVEIEDKIFIPAIRLLERRCRQSDVSQKISNMIAGGGEQQEALSEREKDVIVCVVQGMSNKEIADHLCIATNTVITHRRNIAKKLQIHTPAGLTIYAIVNNLVDIKSPFPAL